MCLVKSRRGLMCALAGLVGALITVPSARATIVQPGQQVSIEISEVSFPIPGTVLGETSKPFSIAYQPPPGFQFDGTDHVTVTGTLTNQVIRDPASGHLAFVYDFDFAEEFFPVGDETSQLVLTDFGRFTTDVRYPSVREFRVSRSVDGTTLTQSRANGNAKLQSFAIFTDASDFDADGKMTMHLEDEVSLLGPIEGEEHQTRVVGGDFGFTGLFQPASGAAAIPLPAAVWAATAALPVLVLGRRRFKWNR
jgi:hypothetical protein